MTTLTDVHDHLAEGYFLQDDIDLLGLKGYVTLAMMKAELSRVLSLRASTPPSPPVSLEEMQRVVAAKAAADAKEAADRRTLIDYLAAKAAAEKAAIDAQNRFLQAISDQGATVVR